MSSGSRCTGPCTRTTCGSGGSLYADENQRTWLPIATETESGVQVLMRQALRPSQLPWMWQLCPGRWCRGSDSSFGRRVYQWAQWHRGHAPGAAADPHHKQRGPAGPGSRSCSRLACSGRPCWPALFRSATPGPGGSERQGTSPTQSLLEPACSLLGLPWQIGTRLCRASLKCPGYSCISGFLSCLVVSGLSLFCPSQQLTLCATHKCCSSPFAGLRVPLAARQWGSPS